MGQSARSLLLAPAARYNARWARRVWRNSPQSRLEVRWNKMFAKKSFHSLTAEWWGGEGLVYQLPQLVMSPKQQEWAGLSLDYYAVMFLIYQEPHHCPQKLKASWCFLWEFPHHIYCCGITAHVEELKILKDHQSVCLKKAPYTSWSSFYTKACFLLKLACSHTLACVLWMTLK